MLELLKNVKFVAVIRLSEGQIKTFGVLSSLDIT